MSQINIPAEGKKITLTEGKLNVPDNPIIPFIEGDGIGPDIWEAAVRVFDAAVEKAYGQAVEDNYGGYQYVKLGDIIDNYMVGYVGDGKLIQTAKKSDVLFWAKRSLQEFSYDTLRSIKSQELTIPESLSLIIPQDYVNYVSLAWIDTLGVRHPIYPVNNLTTNPYYTNLQDEDGLPTQDNFGENIEGSSIIEERWKDANVKFLNVEW